MMNIPPINSVAPYQGAPKSITENGVKEPDSFTSPFRAWTRAAGKILSATSVTSALSSPKSSEAFWAQWREKKWKAAS